jgi:hypothetical protein
MAKCISCDRYDWIVLVAFAAGSLIVFGPSFDRIFASDDYCTLEQVCTKGYFLVPGFFRPAGDITLKWTWQLVGWQPFYFFLGNALLHAINSWLLFLLCRRLYADRQQAFWFAGIASVIFFSYHSHGEAILWAIGRGISLATFFALSGMVIFLTRIREAWKILAACVCYFLGLASYESVALLPAILWLLSKTSRGNQNFRKWWMALGITLLVNVVLREIYSGGVWMAYRGSIFWKDPIAYVSDTIKIILRVFMPAFNRPILFAALSSLVVAGVAALIFLRRKKILADPGSRNVLRLALGGLVCSIAVAMVFSISTRTSEGDRLLYFPACFFAMLVALLLMQLETRNARWLIGLGIIVAQVVFLVQTRNNWIRASSYARQIVQKISESRSRPLYIVNLPEEFRGAYIFRNCLPEALSFYGVNADGVKIVNKLGYVDARYSNGRILPQETGRNIFIPPNTSVIHRGDTALSVANGRAAPEMVNVSLRSILYWDKETLRSLR